MYITDGEMRFLIIDDNEDMRRSIINSICVDGDEFCESEDGENAVEYFAQFRPDWVLMDIKMKKVNGLVATRIIKQKYPDAKIAILTSYDSEAYRTAAEIVGADRFYSKTDLERISLELREIVV